MGQRQAIGSWAQDGPHLCLLGVLPLRSPAGCSDFNLVESKLQGHEFPEAGSRNSKVPYRNVLVSLAEHSMSQSHVY